MKRVLLLLVTISALAAAGRAQTKITALPSGTPISTDIVPFVADPSGSAATKKTTVADLLGVQHTNCPSNQFGNATSAAGVLQCAQVSFSNLSGSVSTSQQPSTTVNSVVNDTNFTGSISAQALMLGFTGTLSKARQHAATVYNDQANTLGAFLQDFTAGSFKAPNSAGAAPTTSALFAYDTTANRFVGGVNGVTKKFLFPDSTDTLTNKTIDGGSNTLTNVGNSSLSNSSITIQGSAVSLGGSALATSSTPQFLRLGLNQAADASAPLSITGAANNITLLRLKRNTDTSPTGNFTDFQNAAGASLWNVDITGSLAAGTVPVARVSGLAAIATSGSASDLGTGTLPNARIVALPNANLANSTITVGSTSIALGSTSTSIAGLSGGVNFGGTTLSTYTEGTFTPALKFGGATTGITYSVQQGKYTQVGDVVYFFIGIILSSKGSATGAATVTGLPVSMASGANDYSSGYARINSATFTGVPSWIIFNASPTTITLEVNSGGTTSNLSDANFTNSTAVLITGQYRTN